MIYYTEKIQSNNLPCPISRFPAILAILFRRVAFTWLSRVSLEFSHIRW